MMLLLLQDVEVETADGVKLHAWLLYLRKWSAEEIKSKPVILFFQVGGERGERGRRGEGRGRERAEGGERAESRGERGRRGELGDLAKHWEYVDRGTLGLFAP